MAETSPPQSPPTRGSNEPSCCLVFGAGCFGLMLLLFTAVPSWGMLSAVRGENPGDAALKSSSALGSGNKVSCTGVSYVKEAYMPWVNDAAAKWLGGDEAALIALIQIESSWNVTAVPPRRLNSTAAGLGQFLTSTAKGMEEFSGGDDTKGKVWPAGTLHKWAEGNEDDARFDPERAIYATAHYMSGPFLKKGLGLAYEENYHGGRTADQKAAARAGRARLEQEYEKVRNSNCESTSTEVSTSEGGSGTVVVGSYAAPIKPGVLRPLLPLRAHHDGKVAVDISVKSQTDLYSLIAGTVTATMHSRVHIQYRPGVSTRGVKGLCGSGVIIKGEDGITYTYCHMDSIAADVVQGARLTAGQYLGKSGNTGRTEGPHLHLGAKGPITASELRRRIESTVK